MENKNNYLWIGIVVLAVILLIVVFVGNSKDNSQNSLTCNSPYIKVGNSCCLDSDDNGVCDGDEQIEEEANVWQLNSFSVDGGISKDFTGCSTTSPGLKVYNNFNNLRDTSSENIEMALFHQYVGEPDGYGRQNEDYQTAILIAYTSYNLDFYDSYEGVACEVEEYYDGVFSEVNTNSFKHNYGLPEDKYGFFIELFYSKNDKPSEAKYVISCKGDESGKEFKKTFRFNIDYVDKVMVNKCY